MAMTKNIESVISKKTGKFIPFETALWTDSFALMEKLYLKEAVKMSKFLPKEFKEMIEKQLEAKVNVIISNPPWRSGRENENVGRKNVEYKNLRERINQTYVKYAKKLGITNVNSLYDTYIQALRMASDRIEEGIIGFVLNNGWLKGLSGRGIRKALHEEFAEVYVYDLKGDARTRGEERRRQGENVFGDQSRAGVCLLFLVKRKDKKEPTKIYYKAVKDYAKKVEKFAELKEWEEKPSQIPWQEIVPNDTHDWIEQGDEEFEGFVKLGDKKNEHETVIFNTYSSGVKTNRDAYVYNFSKDDIKKYMGRLIDTFNEHLEKAWKKEITSNNVEEKIEKDIKKIKWDSTLKKWLLKLKEQQEYKEDRVFLAFYRPFIPMYVYFDKVFNNTISFFPSIFPTPDTENLAIAVSGKGSDYFDTFITDRITDLGFLSPTQIFPLYIYVIETKLFEKTVKKIYNITDDALEHFQKTLNDNTITKKDVFYYVFGVLSTPSYVEKFKNNLTKELPRVPILENFKEISELGKQLAVLQIVYQRYVSAVVMKDKEKPELPEYSNLTITANENTLNEYVEKVKLGKKNREITINEKVKVQNIPEFAFECKVGNYPPIEWISKYLVKEEDKDSGIIWDPKIKVEEFIDIVKKLVAFSQICLEIKGKLDERYN
jgi:predicted helicase